MRSILKPYTVIDTVYCVHNMNGVECENLWDYLEFEDGFHIYGCSKCRVYIYPSCRNMFRKLEESRVSR